MKIGNGGSFKQVNALLNLAIEQLMTWHRMKKVLSSGILAAVFNPGANLDPVNLERVREALGLGTVRDLICESWGALQDAAQIVGLIEKRGGVVTPAVKELIACGQLATSDSAITYRAWIARVENISGTSIQSSAMNMGLTCPPPEIGLLLRAVYSQKQIGPKEVVVPCLPMELPNTDTRQNCMLCLRSDEGGRDVLDVYLLDMHQGTTFKPDQYFVFVNQYQKWGSVPDPRDE